MPATIEGSADARSRRFESQSRDERRRTNVMTNARRSMIIPRDAPREESPRASAMIDKRAGRLSLEAFPRFEPVIRDDVTVRLVPESDRANSTATARNRRRGTERSAGRIAGRAGFPANRGINRSVSRDRPPRTRGRGPIRKLDLPMPILIRR